jgi:hypothetical protein
MSFSPSGELLGLGLTIIQSSFIQFMQGKSSRAFRGVILARFKKSLADPENEWKLWDSTKVPQSMPVLANARFVEDPQELLLRLWRRLGEAVRDLVFLRHVTCFAKAAREETQWVPNVKVADGLGQNALGTLGCRAYLSLFLYYPSMILVRKGTGV